MNVTINGFSKEISDGQSLSLVVAHFCRQPKSIIAEVNGQIITAKDWSSTHLKEGDKIELVAFVGGG